MTTTTAAPIELHVLDYFGSSFNIEGDLDAAAIFECQEGSGKVEKIIYFCTVEFKQYIEDLEGIEEEIEEKEFLGWLMEESEEQKKEGIEFICYKEEVLNHLNEFINSDYNTLSKTKKQ